MPTQLWQAQNVIVCSVRPDTLRRHLEKVAAALSVVSGAVPLRSCEGPLVADFVEKLLVEAARYH